MGFEWNEMGLDYFRSVLCHFSRGMSMLINSSVFHESAGQELQNFYPKHSFVVAHEHAHELPYFSQICSSQQNNLNFKMP